jgi:hypothetical protein
MAYQEVAPRTVTRQVSRHVRRRTVPRLEHRCDGFLARIAETEFTAIAFDMGATAPGHA